MPIDDLSYRVSRVGGNRAIAPDLRSTRHGGASRRVRSRCRVRQARARPYPPEGEGPAASTCARHAPLRPRRLTTTRRTTYSRLGQTGDEPCGRCGAGSLFMRLLPADDPALPLNEQVICAGVERADRVAVRAVGSVIAVEPQPGAAQVNPFAELDEHLAPTRSVLLRLPPVALRVGEKHVKPVSERPVCRQTEVDLDAGGEARTLHTRSVLLKHDGCSWRDKRTGGPV